MCSSTSYCCSASSGTLSGTYVTSWMYWRNHSFFCRAPQTLRTTFCDFFRLLPKCLSQNLQKSPLRGHRRPCEGDFYKFWEIRSKLWVRVRGLLSSTCFLTFLFDMNCAFLTAVKNRSGGPRIVWKILGKFTVWNSRCLAGKFLVGQLYGSLPLLKGGPSASAMDVS